MKYTTAMTLSKKTVGVIIALTVIALSGLILLQSYLLYNAMELKEQAFRRNVLAALNSVVQKLETTETARRIMVIAGAPAGDHNLTIHGSDSFWVEQDSCALDSMFVIEARLDIEQPVRFKDDTIFYSLQSPQHVKIEICDLDGGENLVILDTFNTTGEYMLNLDDERHKQGLVMVRMTTDSSSFVLGLDEGSQSGTVGQSGSRERNMLVRKVLDDMTIGEFRPVESRIDPERLDSLIRLSLAESGVDMPYAYGVISQPGDSLRIAEPAGYAEELGRSEFSARLFPHDFFSSRNDLALHFPERDIFLWKEIGPLLISSVVFMLIIIVCFVYTIRTIISQRRYAGQLVGFINNMTHEFKTPISTVALATEAIKRPDIISQQDKVERYNQMIRDENLRMRNQVDKILQMAVIEEGDYDLKLSDVDVHQIIQKAVGNVALSVENRHGTIQCSLDAEDHSLQADALHLTNIIHNLLDNANKYSPDSPEIRVSTRNSRKGITIAVEDRGIGMRDESMKRVFDKYYRVPVGNLHDVKGFGLGLSYVKLMVEAHGGTVSLRSEYGKGTTVEVFLPLTGRSKVDNHG
jgi:two-component system phosphate regulon sensor histidine kinase PhoR